MAIFDRLGFNFTETAEPKGIFEFSEQTIQFLDGIPPILNQWQEKDLRDDNVGGYIQNPIEGITNNIKGVAQSILSVATYATDDGFGGTIIVPVTGLSGVVSECTNIVTQSNAFIEHTDRISGVTSVDEESELLLPDYDRAMAVGTALTFAIYQLDGISDNRVIMGNFTSLLIKNDLTTNYNTIQPYIQIISDSIVTDIETGEKSTTLPSGTITQIQNDLASVKTLMQTRRTHDENFFANSQQLSDQIQALERVNSTSSTEQNLFINFIGTEKLVSRLQNQ